MNNNESRGMPPVMGSSAADEEYIRQMDATLDLQFDPVLGTSPKATVKDEKFFKGGVDISKIGNDRGNNGFQQIPTGSSF